MKKTPMSAVILVIAALAALGATAAWAAVAATSSTTGNGYYGSMMESGGMMSSGNAMMGYSPARAHPVGGPAEAKRVAQRFADRLGLKAGEVLQFERNYYVKLLDRKGQGATEVLVDPQTGTVTLEYGPAMMWNTRYGMHGPGMAQMMGGYGVGMMRSGGMMNGTGGMMGGGMMGGDATPSATASSLREDAARKVARRWLDANRPGLKVESGGDAFPGYYTFEVLKQGKIDGMMSVDAATGAVVYHWWHGAFVIELA